MGAGHPAEGQQAHDSTTVLVIDDDRKVVSLV